MSQIVGSPCWRLRCLPRSASAALAPRSCRADAAGVRCRQAFACWSTSPVQAGDRARSSSRSMARTQPLARQGRPDQQDQGAGHGHGPMDICIAGAGAGPLCGRGPSRPQRQWRARTARTAAAIRATRKVSLINLRAAFLARRLHRRQRSGAGRRTPALHQRPRRGAGGKLMTRPRIALLSATPSRRATSPSCRASAPFAPSIPTSSTMRSSMPTRSARRCGRSPGSSPRCWSSTAATAPSRRR